MTEQRLSPEDLKVSGYAHRAYAESLAEFGSPLELRSCRGWLLQRRIPASDLHDAMGCYPVFSCLDWSRLREDLDDLSAELVSVTLVTDPFGDYDVGYLKECFEDVVIPFKQHFVTDLSRAPETFVNAHHRRNARKALREVTVKRCEDPVDFLDDWTTLYKTLVERYSIKGITAFSRESFARQLSVPGIVAFRAVHEGVAAGMLLWYLQGDVAYYHLGAYSDRGYSLGASFALFNYSIKYFAQHGPFWLSLGGGAGTQAAGTTGLTRFKQGWSTGVRTAYFCGRIFDQRKYRELVAARGMAETKYFPAYRVGEFS